MSSRKKPEKGTTSGNFIAEWFGHRVWDSVDFGDSAIKNQSTRTCPFLSSAIGETKRCIKTSGRSSPTGVCTISSDSNGIRQNWLACPYRTLDEEFTILTKAIRLLYDVHEDTPISIFSGERIKTEEGRNLLQAKMNDQHERVFVFMADKLGGEIDFPETQASPGTKVDVSVIEVKSCNESGTPSEFGKHLIYEIQTADFHGSPLHAVKELEEIFPEGCESEDCHKRLSEDIEICGIGVEGPNKSNVFKRTFYQAVLKILMAQHNDCAGFVLILPSSVWSSWKKHLGNPEIKKIDSQKSILRASHEDPENQLAINKSWIFVFDIDHDSETTPHPLILKEAISASAHALQEHAFEKAARAAFKSGVINKYREVFYERIQSSWGKPKKRKSTKKV